MIEFRRGDILAEQIEALVNTVNCVGVMGRGIALQFKNAFPENFRAYAAACKRGEVVPGRVFVFDSRRLTPPRYIINFPTKRHWRERSRLEDIETGLDDLLRQIESLRIRSIALPPLGSGLGGLKWSQVRPRIERTLGSLAGVRVIVYEPGGAPAGARERVAGRPVNKMTPGRAALVLLIQRYLRGAMDPFVTLLEVHKLLYFMQEAGEPLRLRFARGHYGPYAENLRHLLRAVEGSFIAGYTEGDDAPGKPLEVLPEALPKAEGVLEGRQTTRERLARVGRLVDGFETPFGLELLSTVHWTAARQAGLTDEDLLREVYGWGERKRRFAREQILLAREVLGRQGWLPVPGEHTGAESKGLRP